MKKLESVYNILCILDNAYRSINEVVPQVNHTLQYKADILTYTANLQAYNLTKPDMLGYIVTKMKDESNKQAFDLYRVLQADSYIKTFSDIADDQLLEARFDYIISKDSSVTFQEAIIQINAEVCLNDTSSCFAKCSGDSFHNSVADSYTES